MHVTLFGSRLFEDVINRRWSHNGLGWGLNPVTGFFIRGEIWRHSHMGRRLRSGWCIYSQWKSRIAHIHQKPEEVRKDPPLELSERTRPCRHLDFRLQASKNEGELISVVSATQFVLICYSSPGKTNTICYAELFFFFVFPYSWKWVIISIICLIHYGLALRLCS